MGLSSHIVRLAVLQFGSIQGLLALLGIEIPDGDGIAGTMSGLHFVGISDVRPEEYQTVELGLNVRHCCSGRRSNSVNSLGLSWFSKHK